MTVALLITCLTDTFFPRVGEAVVRVLRHFGCEVEFPEQQTCCGQPLFNSGFHAEAATLAERTLRLFEPYEYVVTPSASCAAMVKHHYAELFRHDAALTGACTDLARRTHEFALFLRDRLGVAIEDHLRLTERTTFHYPCHARGIYTPAELVQMLGGCVELVPALATGCGGLRAPKRVDLCCGFGGAFAVDFAPVSDAMLTDKLAELVATGAATAICNEAGCAMQIAGGAHRRGLPLRCRHVAELLAESLGLMEPPA